MSRDFDVIVVGSGPAGYSCSMQAAKYGKNVLVVEASMDDFGGAWINTGTVPSKALREAAYTIHKYHKLVESDEKPFMKYRLNDLLKFKDGVQEQENKSAKNYLIKNDVKTLRGYATVIDPHTIEVKTHIGETKRYTTDYMLLSTGSKPVPPTAFDIDHTTVRDITSILKLDHFPRRLTIIGASVHAMEYASIFTAMGTIVTILNPNKGYLNFLDEEVHKVVEQSFEDLGILIINEATIDGVGFNPLRNKTEVKYHIENKDELEVIETEQVLYIGGRVPNTDKIGLENVDTDVDESGFIKVDDEYRTACPSIFSAGDVIGYPSLASASFSQGRLAACHMFDIPAAKVSSLIPFSIYTIPETASVGMTEQEAIDEGYEVTVGRAYFDNLTRAQISSSSLGILKLVIETDTYKLLGVHIAGDKASEIIHLGQSVITSEETVHFFIRNIINYPTYSQAYRTAAFNGINRINKLGKKYQQK